MCIVLGACSDKYLIYNEKRIQIGPGERICGEKNSLTMILKWLPRIAMVKLEGLLV